MPRRRSFLAVVAILTTGCVQVTVEPPPAPAPPPFPEGKVLDPTSVERDIAAQFEDREGVALQIACAEEMVVAVGATYRCDGTTADGEDVALSITVTDEDPAGYTWAEP